MDHFVTPDNMLAEVERRAETISPSDFIRKPKNKLLKEAWCAGRFGLGYARHVAPCLVKVNPEENSNTDFWLKKDDLEFPFQTVLADEPDRRMGSEYVLQANGLFRGRPYRPERGRVEGPLWIKGAIEGKLMKGYSDISALHLLVYANFTAHEIEYGQLLGTLEEVTGRFASIWVLFNHLVCSIESPTELGSLKRMARIDEQIL